MTLPIEHTRTDHWSNHIDNNTTCTLPRMETLSAWTKGMSIHFSGKEQKMCFRYGFNRVFWLIAPATASANQEWRKPHQRKAIHIHTYMLDMGMPWLRCHWLESKTVLLLVCCEVIVQFLKNPGRLFLRVASSQWGDGMTQLVERRTRDPKTRGSNSVRGARKNCKSCTESQMSCRLVVGVPNPRMYTHTHDWSRTHV